MKQHRYTTAAVRERISIVAVWETSVREHGIDTMNLLFGNYTRYKALAELYGSAYMQGWINVMTNRDIRQPY